MASWKSFCEEFVLRSLIASPLIEPLLKPGGWQEEKCVYSWGGSRGGSGGLVENPKLNVKTYNKRVVKKKVNQPLNYCS